MDVGIQVLFLIWIVLLVVTLLWGHATNRGASIAAWLGLTLVSWWIEFVVAFVALHAALFSLGREAVIVLALLLGGIIALTPVAWAYVLSHRNKSHVAPK